MPGTDDPQSLKAVGERLYLLRKALDYTQDFIAVAVGVTQPAWSQYEGGRNRPEYEVTLQLELFTGAPQEWVTRGIADRMRDDLKVKIAVAAREIERQKRKKASRR